VEVVILDSQIGVVFCSYDYQYVFRCEYLVSCNRY